MSLIQSLKRASLSETGPCRFTSLSNSRVMGAPQLCANANAEQILLGLVASTDRGATASPDQRRQIAELIEELEKGWEGTDAFSQSAYLLRETEVVYVGQNSSVKANAAGGRYRGRIGRALFRTDALFQHVLKPDVAVNVVHFRLFGLLPGAAVLRGRWSVPAQTELEGLRGNSSRELSANTLSVEFEPPRIAFGQRGMLLNLQLGPKSSVGLDTTYLSRDLRICRGASSGTAFVFRADTVRDGAALSAASRRWEEVCESKPTTSKTAAVLLSALAALAAVSPLQPLRPFTLPLMGLAVLLLTSTGGIVVRRDGKVPPDAGAGEPVADPC